MKTNAANIRFSASDLSNHLACNHLTALDLAVAIGSREAPKWNSPDAWVLQQRGMAHESAYIQHLESQGHSIVNLRDVGDEKSAFAQTCAAMQTGADIIVQGVLTEDVWFGRADVFRKVSQPSKLGAWSYEVYDCKLALETKAATILQLSLYSELVGGIQGRSPEFMHVVPPSDGFIPESYRVFDFGAYYRHVKRRLQNAVEEQDKNGATYPEPTEHCPVCRWWGECEERRRKDDHLSLVAGITRLQRKQLSLWDVTTVKSLSDLPLPLQRKPERGSKNGYVRVREQARVQVAGRIQEKPLYEVLELNQEHGFYGLPEPSFGDVFFDLEGDPFVGHGGREYLFGFAAAAGSTTWTYENRWAVNPEEEKQAFEWFVDRVMAQWARHPSMHVYHYTGYESGALKRLMGRYATREDEIDRMLRARLFVDLHAILKRTVRASVEQYSLKALEVFHNFERKIDLDVARHATRQMQHYLELGGVTPLDESIRETVMLYNADDCFSTGSLRTWLEGLRRSSEEAGHVLARPTPSDGAPPETVDERQQRTAALAARLQTGVPDDPEQRGDEEAARWLLSNLLDWHRRELKSEWWEFYRLGELSDEDLLDEKSALSGLHFVERLGVQRNIPTDRYAFEKQETDVRAGDELCLKGEKLGEVVSIDIAMRTVDIKKTKKTAEIHPFAAYVKDIGPGTDILAEAVYRIGAWVDANGVDAHGPYRAARDLLLRRPPRLSNGNTTLILPGETTVVAAQRLGTMLDSSVLAIQGPPGSGKTFTGARMICELVRQGKRVGITATSHKVIGKLLRDAVSAAVEAGIPNLRAVQKVRKEDKPEHDPPHILTTVDNKETLAAFLDGANVLAGTQWLWTQEEYFEAVDVLFVDEAGQMSLTNVLAVAQAAKSLVLLGDPQQLEQPLKGSHPDGADISALEHILGGAKTIASDRGLFLEQTWRLHPRLCEFTSEVFYEGRLSSHEGLDQQRIEGHPWLGDAGLWFVPVSHEGNQNSSLEEVEIVATLVQELLHSATRWIGENGTSRPLELNDILIVAPYNAQVLDLAARIPNARIGTVDKFQGQQAPIVIYSLTSSSPEDAPRGMEFLYSPNRLNVATSRAQAMVILVGSLRLLEPECHSPRQMQLANGLCRCVELAKIR
ncbi:MAG TPA: TM0106 family RecB-like putative nuclease [Bryobacteraceae bacterium]|nr:TM0106 family RecB-like putative nuclease [Bryobacteraceae bacterium]